MRNDLQMRVNWPASAARETEGLKRAGLFCGVALFDRWFRSVKIKRRKRKEAGDSLSQEQNVWHLYSVTIFVSRAWVFLACHLPQVTRHTPPNPVAAQADLGVQDNM